MLIIRFLDNKKSIYCPSMPKPPAFDPVTDDQFRNKDYVNAHLAVASLTIAWHYVLSVPDHEETAMLVEKALESAARLRGRVK